MVFKMTPWRIFLIEGVILRSVFYDEGSQRFFPRKKLRGQNDDRG